jgi:hypothetical protein
MSGDYQHEAFETFSWLRWSLREYGYTPDLDPIIDRFLVNHPLWFDGLVAEGLVEKPCEQRN